VEKPERSSKRKQRSDKGQARTDPDERRITRDDLLCLHCIISECVESSPLCLRKMVRELPHALPPAQERRAA
jgi:hypothetical protein